MTRNTRKHAELHSPEALIGLLGPHPATSLGLDLDAGNGDADLGRWLMLSILLGGRTSETIARDAYLRLQKESLIDPSGIAEAGVAAVHTCLEPSELRKSEAVAAVLVRVGANLLREYQGKVERLAGSADDLEDLAHGLSRLGAGFGKAAIFRFLTPLRTRWSAASDLPATTAVLAAAVHLGIVADAQDEEGVPSSLASWVDRNASPSQDVPVRDLEAALDRLGRTACLRKRSTHCPLTDSCPLHSRS